jgi:acylphosphatase
MTICKKVTYWGKVQGVGFRYTASEIAHDFPVTGYVKNLLDGQVELMVEGKLVDVERFLDAVNVKLAGYVKGQKQQDEAPQGFAGFGIRS